MNRLEAILKSWYCAALASELRSGRTHRSPFCGRTLTLSPGARAGSITARLDGRPAPCRVQDGVVFVWFDPAGGEPLFTVPQLPHGGFGSTIFDVFTTTARPELVMCDLADIAHFNSVHGYLDVSPRPGPSYSGSSLRLDLDFDWPVFAASDGVTTRARTRSRCDGLGYQLTETTTLGGRFVIRHRVMPTPLHEGRIQITVGLEVKVLDSLARVPGSAALARAFARRAFARDIQPDMALWRRLMEGTPDRGTPAMQAYWDWVEQFRSTSTSREVAA